MNFQKNKRKIKNKKNGFTLVELMVVVFIISVISTLVTVSFFSIRRISRDGKRISDIIDLQLVLENYKFFEGSYPEELISGQPLIGTTTGNIYMSQVPSNPKYQSGSCPWSYYGYVYDSETDNYEISFCLEGDIKKYSAGINCAIPNNILSQSCVTLPWSCGVNFIDTRDSNVYPTVQIGNQCWMAKNLAYLPEVHNNSEFQIQGINSQPGYGVYGYNGDIIPDAKDQSNYSTYGVLYNFPAVIQTGSNAICPAGWSVPTDAQWSDLTDYLSANSQYWCGSNFAQIGKSLSNTSGWTAHATACRVGNSQSSNNTSGFTALPAGARGDNGVFLSLGGSADFWSSSGDGGNAWGRGLSSGSSGVFRYSGDQANGFSVRCLKN